MKCARYQHNKRKLPCFLFVWSHNTEEQLTLLPGVNGCQRQPGVESKTHGFVAVMEANRFRRSPEFGIQIYETLFSYASILIWKVFRVLLPYGINV